MKSVRKRAHAPRAPASDTRGGLGTNWVEPRKHLFLFQSKSTGLGIFKNGLCEILRRLKAKVTEFIFRNSAARFLNII